MLDRYMTERQAQAQEDEDFQRVIRVAQFDHNGRLIKGIFEAGEYGYTADLVDVKTGQVTYSRKTTDAELLPFYFRVWAPETGDRAILLLQRFRQFGVRSAFWFDFNDFFPYGEEIGLELNPLVHSQLIEEVFKDATIRRLRFIKFSLPSDVTDRLFEYQQVHEEDGHLEFVVAAKRRGRLPIVQAIKDFLNGEGQLSSIIELPDFDYDTIKVELDVDGRTRTIDLAEPAGIRSYYDVTSDVSVDASGHPDFESIDVAAEELLLDLQSDLGLSK